MKITTRVNGLALIAALALCLAACGGGDDAPPPVAPAPPPPVAPAPVVGIGTSGGTVTHVSGASVVVPAGALTQNTVIEIAQSSAGAPALPAGVTTAGAVFAFTPHGTTFATPVTVTVPFDPALVPAGTTPVLYKTNAARSAYEPVAGAVVSGNSLVGEVTSFSNLAPAIPPVVVVPPVTNTGPPIRSWAFSEFRGDDLEKVHLASGGEINGGPPEGDIGELYEFGAAYFDSAIALDATGHMQAADGIASGDIGSFANGITYWVGAEAPLGNTGLPEEPIGSESELIQIQSYVKNADDASYHFTLTQIILEALDGNGVLARNCPAERVVPTDFIGDPGGPDFYCDLISAEVLLSVSAYLPFDPALPCCALSPTLSEVSGGASLKGSAGAWEALAWDDDSSTIPFLYSEEAIEFETFDFKGPEGHARFALHAPRTFSLDLSAVDVGQTFEVVIKALATTYNRANSPVGGAGSEFETNALAFLRDPATFGGTTVTTNGLTPVATPLPLATRVEAPVEPAACVPGPAPDPEAGTLQFGAATFASSESSLTPVVTVTRIGGSQGAVTATFRTSNGTALSGVDYTAKNSSVFFGDGDAATRRVAVSLINDLTDEPDKTVNLTLSQPGGCAALGAPTTAVLTIRDDEVIPQTLFTVGGTVTGLGSVGNMGEPPMPLLDAGSNSSIIMVCH
jgi:hypothetical protein